MTAFVATAWALFVVVGVDGLLRIAGRDIPEYPASGQVVLYAGIPFGFLAIIAGSVVLSRKARWFYDLYPFAVGLCAFALFPVLMVWGGGV